MRQTTVQEMNSIRFGSGLFEVSDDGIVWVNLGAMRNINFEESWDKVTVESDNAGPVRIGIRNHRAALGGDLMEINLANLHLIRGGLDNYVVDAAGAPVDAFQRVAAGDWASMQFIEYENQNHDLSAITLADVAGGDSSAVAEAGTDGTTVNITGHGLAAGDYIYNVTRDAIGILDAGPGDNSFDLVAPITGQAAGDVIMLYETYATGITAAIGPDGKRGIYLDTGDDPALTDNVLIVYEYEPAASRTLSSGGYQTINPRLVRVTNENEEGNIFRITVFKAEVEEGINITLPPDDGEDPAMVPIKLEGTTDSNRPIGDRLFEIYDAQNV